MCLRLCTHPEWIESYYNAGLYKSNDFEKNTKSLKQDFYHERPFLWGDPAFFKKLAQVLHTMKNHFDIDCGLTTFHVHDDYVDSFNYAYPRDALFAANRFFTYYENIKKYNHYFLFKASDLIQTLEKNQLYLPFIQQIDDSTTFKNCDEDLQLSRFMEQLQMERANITHKGKIFHLSKRETQCIVYRLRGYSAKEIARMLKLSDRTVENYLNNIKTKGAFQSIPEMLCQAQASPSPRFLCKE